MERKTPVKPTSWELGNELLHRVMDNLLDSAKEMEEKFPAFAALLRRQHQELVPMYRRLTGDKTLL